MMCLVTGGAGFIGSHLVDALIARGFPVRVLDNLSSGRAENLQAVASRIEFLEGDVRDRNTVERAVAGVDCVFHQAAVPSIPWSVDRPAENHEVNATGTLNVLVAARDAGVRRVIYASSCSVYGDTERLPLEEDLPPRPGSPYSVAKLMGEYYCQVFSAVYRVPAVALRYFNVFGPRQRADSQYGAAIPTFIARLEAGEPPIIFGDGQQSRDFIAVDNVVHANLLAMTAERAPGRIFNVGSGRRYTVLELLGALSRVCGRRVRPVFRDPRPGEARHSLAGLRAATQGLGYTVVTPLEEGLARTVAWFRGEGVAAPRPRA